MVIKLNQVVNHESLFSVWLTIAWTDHSNEESHILPLQTYNYKFLNSCKTDIINKQTQMWLFPCWSCTQSGMLPLLSQIPLHSVPGLDFNCTRTKAGTKWKIVTQGPPRTPWVDTWDFLSVVKGLCWIQSRPSDEQTCLEGAVVKSLPVTLCPEDLLEIIFTSSFCPSFVHLNHKFCVTTQQQG